MLECEPPLAHYCHLRPEDVRALTMRQFDNFVTFTSDLIKADNSRRGGEQ